MFVRITEWLQRTFPSNRLVILATPIAAALAGYICTWTTKHIAFLHLDQGQTTAVFISGIGLVVTMAYKWLDGWQKHEQSVRENSTTSRT